MRGWEMPALRVVSLVPRLSICMCVVNQSLNLLFFSINPFYRSGIKTNCQYGKIYRQTRQNHYNDYRTLVLNREGEKYEAFT